MCEVVVKIYYESFSISKKLSMLSKRVANCKKNIKLFKLSVDV